MTRVFAHVHFLVLGWLSGTLYRERVLYAGPGRGPGRDTGEGGGTFYSKGRGRGMGGLCPQGGHPAEALAPHDPGTHDNDRPGQILHTGTLNQPLLGSPQG